VLAAHGAAGVTEIATKLGVHKSTVFRLLSTLESRGLVDRAALERQLALVWECGWASTAR
jgi:DNA-binding IclR family transcriptional regulator